MALPMRIICCYTQMDYRSWLALVSYAPKVVFVDTSASIYDYGNAIAEYWDGAEDLVVIEGDKEITSEVIPSFATCEQPWCAYSYTVSLAGLQKQTSIGLGCTKYSASLQRLVSCADFGSDDPLWPSCPFCDGRGCWLYLDARIARAIRYHDIDVHRHGSITHHHDVENDFLSSPLEIARVQNSKTPVRTVAEMQAIDNELAGPEWPYRDDPR